MTAQENYFQWICCASEAETFGTLGTSRAPMPIHSAAEGHA